MTANNNNTNNNNIDQAALKVELKDALAAVRQAILNLHVKIEAEQDPIKKQELIGEMQGLSQQIGLVFDHDKESADLAAEQLKKTTDKVKEVKEDIMKDAKPSLWVRFKTAIAAAWARTSKFVGENKVAVTVGAVAIIAAVGGYYASRNGRVVLERGFTEATVNDATVEITSTDNVTETSTETVPTFFEKVGGYVINGAVAAKDLAVRGAVYAKDLAVAGAQKVGNFFTKKSVTPYTVEVEAAVA